MKETIRSYTLTITLVFISFLSTFSQGFKLEVFAGLINYQGDLQPQVFTLKLAKPVYGGCLKYEFNGHITARAGVSHGNIYADDKFNKLDLQNRNLNFRSKITEAHLGIEYYILNIHNYKLSPYLFAGIATLKFNPYTFDQSGAKIFLQPLGTEGQGISQAMLKEYKLQQVAIPFGGGINIAVSCNLNIALELLQHKLSTDYLDDVSATYADENALLNARGAKAVELAFRSDELNGNQPYPAAGSQRGNPGENDWYYMATLKICFNLKDCNTGKFIFGDIFSKKRGSTRNTGCPVNVY